MTPINPGALKTLRKSISPYLTLNTPLPTSILALFCVITATPCLEVVQGRSLPQLREGRSHNLVIADFRLMKEYRDLTADPLQDSITAGPVSEDNMLEWEALIQGPEDTPYVSRAEVLRLTSGRRCLCGQAKIREHKHPKFS
jgi:hypothetical protein